MKTKIVTYDELTEKLAYEKKRKEIDDPQKVTTLKTSVNKLKLEWQKIEQRIGIVKSILPQEKIGEKKEEEIHHLYDDIIEL